MAGKKFYGDFIPEGKRIIEGELRDAPPDPYVLIEQQKARILDLERQAKTGEALDLQVAVSNLTKELNAARELHKSLTTQLQGAKAHSFQVEKERDAAREEASELRMQVHNANRLPPVTDDMRAKADQARAADQAIIDEGKAKARKGK